METVLVVDDEPLVVTLVQRVLAQSGYHVIATSDPQEALSICRDLNTRIDILLTDLIMPGMNGKQLRDKIADIRPYLKVIFMSGYADPGTRDILGCEPSQVLMKPFGLPSLITAVRNGLERKPLSAAESSPESAVA